MRTSPTKSPADTQDASSPTPTTRLVQAFVFPDTDPAAAARSLAATAGPVQLIPASPAALVPADALAASLRRSSRQVEITLPLRDGTDLSAASSVLRV